MTADEAERERFYAFERECRARFESSPPLDLDVGYLRDIVLTALDAEGWSLYPVMVVGIEQQCRGWCAFDGETFTIALPPGYRRTWVALHEAAHVLTWGHGHGPTFATCVLRLWRAFGDWPSAEVDRLAWERLKVTAGSSADRAPVF